MGSAVLGCRPVSSRLISIRLRAAPFNVTIIQVYAPTSGHDDNEVDNFYRQRQEIIDQTPKKDILAVQGDCNAKVGRDAQADWGDVCGPYCNAETNERCLRLLELATFNNLVLINTLGPNKPSAYKYNICCIAVWSSIRGPNICCIKSDPVLMVNICCITGWSGIKVNICYITVWSSSRYEYMYHSLVHYQW